MIHFALPAVTVALLIVCGSGDISERPCFIPPLINMVVNNSVIRPYEFQASVVKSLINMTGVEVDASKYKLGIGMNHLKGIIFELTDRELSENLKCVQVSIKKL